MLNEFALGDRVQMRKKHACGANEWEITHTGADIRIKCVNCGRSLMLDRLDFMRAAKKRIHIAECGVISVNGDKFCENVSDSAEKASEN